jgi:site-specific DNA-cytosine methylase
MSFNMKHLDLFSGIGGFALALEKVYGNNNVGRVASPSDTEDGRNMPLPESSDGNGRTKYGLGKDLNWQRPDSHDLSKANYEKIEISDSQRYKLCGNGVVVNVVEEIIKNVICNSEITN